MVGNHLTYTGFIIIAVSSGNVTSVLGLVIEVQLFGTSNSIEVISSNCMSSIGIRCDRSICYVSVYDSVLVYRPSISFRDGTLISNPVLASEQSLCMIPYADSYHM